MDIKKALFQCSKIKEAKFQYTAFALIQILYYY